MIKRAIMGTIFALFFGLTSFAISSAQTVPEAYSSDNCGDCHEVVTTQWQNSVHGQASQAEAFLAAWVEQGSPPDCLRCHTTGFKPETGTYEKEGVACSACHPSNPDEHPQKIMQTDISAGLCGRCHLDTFAEWETSQHGEEGLSCVRCHNPHSNELRSGSMRDTCRSCHKQETHFYTFTPHAEEGLVCTDCHFHNKTTPLGDGHSKQNHSFSVGAETCSYCHNDEMHSPADFSVRAEGDPGIMQAGFLTVQSSEEQSVQPEPSVTSPYNFAILAALIGMAFGLVGSPWLERWQERLRNQEMGGGHDK